MGLICRFCLSAILDGKTHSQDSGRHKQHWGVQPDICSTLKPAVVCFLCCILFLYLSAS